MSSPLASKIQNNPKYHHLVQQRDALAWSLSAIVCVIYFGFILMIAFTPGFLTQPISSTSVIPVGMLIGVGVIVASCLLTAVYVSRANGTFDPLTQEIIEEASK
ncbi:MAG: DUF485 domain-containing protein [Betaproteobacteria bacterium]|nr:DUF485 domain-containing protein [Betaproteobacteria bacterium]MDE1981367.1 DUF485 domain-containing protein [Betaproteobacteria bacterium]MDE2131270.1 DUF485 domain-containing protein [Betaproteobacteria bacterium]MDE2211327.1 DUF485 domain-containing protein [Betaproteobacteria bacterium]MDE2623896.1 DUF485 domain-containing protein [Betaproteobacteria bacterium]